MLFTSVAVIARAHGVNANQVFHWRRLCGDRLLEKHKPERQFVAARIIEAKRDEQRRVPATSERHSGTIDIQIGGVRVRITGSGPSGLRSRGARSTTMRPNLTGVTF